MSEPMNDDFWESERREVIWALTGSDPNGGDGIDSTLPMTEPMRGKCGKRLAVGSMLVISSLFSLAVVTGWPTPLIAAALAVVALIQGSVLVSAFDKLDRDS